METIYLIIERLIQWSGETESLQDFRSWMLSRTTEFDGCPASKAMTTVLKLEHQLRCTIQREQHLHNTVQALLNSENTLREEENGQLLQNCQQELQVLNKKYWYLAQLWFIRKSQLKEPILRGFTRCRSNPKWYLSDTLCQHCAESGGCCGRECQCCEKRTETVNRKIGAGHCTLECECCSKARGFEFTSEEKKQLYGRYGPGRHLDRFHCVRLISAGFWGVRI